jgi:hypothetical protein
LFREDFKECASVEQEVVPMNGRGRGSRFVQVRRRRRGGYKDEEGKREEDEEEESGKPARRPVNRVTPVGTWA